MAGQEFELREQDRWLPIANVARLMKNTLPSTAKVSKDAKECMQECVSEFISFVTSEASDRCLMEKRKTINGEDVLYSLHTLGFENYAEVLKIYLAKYRQQQALKQERGEIRMKKKKKSSDDNDNEIVKNEAYENLTNNQQINNEIFQRPIDDSITVLNQEINDQSENINNNNNDDDDGDNNNDDANNINEKKTNYNEEYVSQLYEQSYADVPLNMANPDYHGNGASESILVKRNIINANGSKEDNIISTSSIIGSDNGLIDHNSRNEGDIEMEDDPGLSLEIGVGVNVHLGNTESLDEINSRINTTDQENIRDKNNLIEENKSNLYDDDIINQENIISIPLSNSNDNNESVLENHEPIKEIDEANNNPILSKTPATTTTSDLLLLNDNIAGISEREEIVGLTNGHSGMYPFE
jgi:histone H3/H4